MKTEEIESLVALGRKLFGSSIPLGADLSPNFRDGDATALHLCEIAGKKDAPASIKAVNKYAELLSSLNLRAACFLMDGVQSRASDAMLHEVWDGAELFFATLSHADLLELSKYTEPSEGNSASNCHQRWLERLEEMQGKLVSGADGQS